MMKSTFTLKTLMGIGAMLFGVCAFGQTSDAGFPTIKDAPELKLFSGNDDDNGVALQKVDDMMKAPKLSVTVDDSETWGEWQSLGEAEVSYSNNIDRKAVSKRYSTVAGHQKIFQIKIAEAYRDIDAVFTGEENDRQPSVSMSGSVVDCDPFKIDGYDYDFVAVGFRNATYNKARGIMTFYTWAFIDSDYNYGLRYSYNVTICDMPQYQIAVSGKNIFSANENSCTFDISHSDNIGEVRFYNMPLGLPGEYVHSYTYPDFETADGVIVKGQNDTQITVDFEGYQPYALVYRYYNTDGVAIADGKVSYFSTQNDGYQWKSIGEAKYADKILQYFFATGDLYTLSPVLLDEWNNMKLTEWNVEMQQCVENPYLYRLVNPYATCPYFKSSVDMYDRYADDNGDIHEDYIMTITPTLDRNQNYYIYLYSTDGFKKSQSYLELPDYPTGITDVYTRMGDTVYDLQLSRVSMEYNNYALFSRDVLYAKLPGYINYDFTLSVDNESGIVTVGDVAEGVALKYQIYGSGVTSEAKDVPSDHKINLNDEALEAGQTYTVKVMSYDEDGIKQVENSCRYEYSLNLSDWTYVGQSTFCDGWILPLYGYDPIDYPWIVDTYISKDNNTIGLLNTYTGSSCVLPSESNSVENVMITIDITDKDFVTIKPQTSGYYVSSWGIVSIADISGYFISCGYGADEVKNAYSGTGYLATLNSDNVINIPKCVYSTDGVNYYNASYGQIYLPIDVSGINNVSADVNNNADAPVEYYNLSGMRIDKPTAAGIYIRRQGSEATKIVVK